MASVPPISVLLPIYNGGATLGRALASLRAQTRPDWELIVVDDGSDDATPELLRAEGAADPRIRVLSPGRVGLVAALNLGLGAARGRFIARMDVDDEAHPERLQAQAGWLETHPGIGLVGCGVAFGGDRVASEGYARHVDWLNGLVTPEEIARNRFVESPLAHPSVMFRRELVAAHGGYRAGDFPEDYELWLRWLDAGVRMGKVPRVLLTWHDAPARLSRTDPRYAPEAFFRVKATYLARALARLSRLPAGEGARPANPAGANDDPGRPREIWVWGAGRPTRQRAAHLAAHGVRIEGYVDVDPKKTGRSVGGLPVVEAGRLPPAGTAFVLGYVGSRGARDLIRAALVARGYVEERDFLICA